MDEFKFVMKCWVLAGLIVAFSQIKTAQGTVEAQVLNVLTSSETVSFVNKAAAGGVKLVETSWSFVKNQYKKNTANPESGKTESSSEAVDKKIVQKAAIRKIDSRAASSSNPCPTRTRSSAPGRK